MLPLLLVGAVGATLICGVHALIYGIAGGAAFGALAVVFGLFVGWLSYRV